MRQDSELSFRIADLNSDDRPREKAMTHGIQSLTDTELMAIILGTGVKGKSVINMSQEILSRHGGLLSQLSRLSIHELSTGIKGMGPAKAVSLMAAIELGTRCCRDLEIEHRDKIAGSDSVFRLMRQRLERLNIEQFWVIYLSQSNAVLSTECVSTGGLAATVVDPRLIFKSAIDKLASGIIMVHNHPSGNNQPSIQDDALTRKLKEGAEILQLKMLDHVIITANAYYSYCDHGRL